MKIEIERPKSAWLCLDGRCQLQRVPRAAGRTRIYFRGKMGFSLLKKGSATLTIGALPHLQPLKELDISPDPLCTLFIPEATGIFDDYFESWFLSFEKPPSRPPEGLESVVNLGLSEKWLPPPKPIPDLTTINRAS